MKKLLIILMLNLLPTFQAGAQVFGEPGLSGGRKLKQSPFGSFYVGRDNPIVRESVKFDIASSINGERRIIFDELWRAFRAQHSIDPRGVFTPVLEGEDAVAVQDNIYSQTEFVRYVHRRQPLLTIERVIECKRCDASGRVPSVQDGLTVVHVACEKCGGGKKLSVITDYTLFSSLPPPARLEFSESAITKAYLPSSLIRENEVLQDALVATRGELDTKPEIGINRVQFSKSEKGIFIDFNLTKSPSIKDSAPLVGIKLFSGKNGTGELLADCNDVFRGVEVKEDAISRRSFAGLRYEGDDPESHPDITSFYKMALTKLSEVKSCVIHISYFPSSGSDSKHTTHAINLLYAPAQVPVVPVVGSPQKPRQISYGSGMVFTKEGHVFTNHHVIKGADTVSVVIFSNGKLERKHNAKVITKDSRLDLAILKLDDWSPVQGAISIPPLLVSSSKCKLGDPVFVLGYPLPDTLSSNVKFTRGDVSDKAGVGDDSSKIQHTAGIQPGNSGGPMSLMDGRVVGIVVSSLSESFALRTSGALPQGVNFSIKSDYLLTMAREAGIEVNEDISQITAATKGADYSPVEHVKAYTVQIMSEK